jgi:glutamate 5-kinase
MITKIKAAKIALDSGCKMVICNGKKKDILNKAINGEEGTVFLPEKSLSNKERWIKFSKAKGRININECAVDVLTKGKSSLLAIGVDGVSGKFDKDSIVLINDIAKGIVDHSSEEINRLKGKKGKVIVKSENIILI